MTTFHTATVAAADINTSGIVTWLATHIVPVGLALLGILIIFGAKAGRLSKVGGQLAVAVVGLLVIASAFSLFAFGDALAGVIFK